MKLKNIFLVVAISVATSLLSIWGYSTYMQKQGASIQEPGKVPVNYAGFFDKNHNKADAPDFTDAATSATPAVVHIKTRIKSKTVSGQGRNPLSDLFGNDDPFFQFFGNPRMQTIPEQRASGSGVIISNDGYIVTNNHVVEGASELTVTLANRKTYKGTVVGTDPNSDIAVIKIDATNLPYLLFGNSDEVKLGQWVLAVGYPLNLDVTVTAGIVSAKARSIGINKGDRPIESFIQTDAAVNPGNSGGALINTNGELIGINSAIASPTGSYAGYSYAIPDNLVKKIVGDLTKFGAVQRAYLGIQYSGNEDLPEEQKDKLGIKDGVGVFVTDAAKGGAANEAGIKTGDFITKINGVNVYSGPELQEQVAGYKPGDKITVSYTRNGKENTVNVMLKNKTGDYNAVKNETYFDKLGGELSTIDKATAQKNNISGGVLVKKLGKGPLKKTRMQEGFVITSVDGQDVNTTDDLKDIFNNAHGTVRIEGIYPGYEGTYGYPLNLDDNSDEQQGGGQ
ncbi:MAG: trypsin-like peptidase domain-containing protein [Parafilimonas sp.]